MISLSYSKISLKDICLKLHLDSEEDAEFIVAKAIRDGVIDAVIVHEAGYVKTKEIADVYSTGEPQDAYNQRISFCLQLHNDSVKALRFPSKPEQNNPDGDLNNDLRELENEIAELEEFDF
jgi:26S proteasome regulatory subunit N3